MAVHVPIVVPKLGSGIVPDTHCCRALGEYGRTMAASNCPRCGTEMVTASRGVLTLTECPEGHGVFLDRADLGLLIEAESDWHRDRTQDTSRLPRITADMTAPPAPVRPRAWVETLFD